MKINVAKTAGFCFGVKRALRIAKDAATSYSKVEMLGDIVHNENVVQDIKNIGIKKVKILSKGKDKTLLIRAHGTAKKVYKDAERLGYSIIDATCPMVKEIHKFAIESEKKGYKLIIIGDKKHDEVLGIVGQLKRKAIVIDNLKNMTEKAIKKNKKAAIVVQSTQDLEKVLKIVKKIKEYIPGLKFFNTICKPTREKQQEIHALPLENDVMIIIGSKTSANTKRLYQISKSLNKQSFWIQSKDNLRPEWFRKAKSVGITAGASTPAYTTQAVINKIKRINPRQ